ncbi:hypothetical protein BH10BAC1_BH10BAC1_20710 [soil metagenome]
MTMRVKCILFLAPIVFSYESKGQEIINNDSTKTALLSFRVAGGASKPYLAVLERNRNYYNPTKFDLSSAYLTALGLKLSTTAKRHASLAIELNYQLGRYDIQYTSYSGGQAKSSSETADYILLLHSAEIALLPKINIGKRIYTSFGPFVNLPFYHTIEGTLINSSSGIFSSYQGTEYKDKDINKSFHPEAGAILNLGSNIKLNKNTLCIELRFQTNLLNTNYTFRFATSSLAIIYTLDSKPIHFRFWTN